MVAKVRFFPIGNADTCIIDADGRKFVFDFAAPTPQGSDDRRIDLAKTLRAELKREKRDRVDVVSFSHLDTDHFAGASEFFHLEHAEKYQGKGRIRIREMWVPAAAIIESKWDQSTEGRIIQAEARHRLKKGKGIRVVSKPEVLDDWLRKQGIDPKTRRESIVGAGNLMPGYRVQKTGIEFFVHAPFSDQRDESEVDRNGESTVFHIAIKDGPDDVRLLLTGDTPIRRSSPDRGDQRVDGERRQTGVGHHQGPAPLELQLSRPEEGKEDNRAGAECPTTLRRVR